MRKPPVYKARQPDANQPTPLTVDKLIDGGRRVWDMITVKEVLNEQDAVLVGKIPLSRINTPDKLIWRDSMVGAFSVRSVYYKSCRVLGRDMVERDHKEKIWSRIWLAKIPPKIKYFKIGRAHV